MYPFIDTHCHLNAEAFNNDLPDVIHRAVDAGVSYIIIPGIDLNSNYKALEICDRYPNCFTAVGIHPNTPIVWDDSIINNLTELFNSPKVVAIGEIGLDFFREMVPRELQQTGLRIQLDLALEYDKPVIIHNRSSTHELLIALNKWCSCIPDNKNIKKCPGVFHAFLGDQEILEFARENSFNIGLGGALTYPKNQTLLTDLLSDFSNAILETDSPYLSPKINRGKRNEPCYLPLIYSQVASFSNFDHGKLAETFFDSSVRLFGLPDGKRS